MNPAELFRLKADLKVFREAHPKFTSFLRYGADHCIKAGNVMEITVRQPDGKEVRSNLRLSEQDADMLLRLYEVLKTEQ